MSKQITSAFGEAKYPHLNQPDTEFNSEGLYQVKLLVSKEDAQKDIKIIDDVIKEQLIIEGKKLGKKKDTCLKVVQSKKYKEIYKAYSFNPRQMNEIKEADNLYKLVGDIRQRPFFKKRFYKYEGSNTLMHQEHIDKIR